ncbi:hypothetical protein [Nocardia veterana]|uniref:DUF8020 domain-containing protein n=1 Tax=Nocardia veterana TaxID=132249 RepID=A0A7X6M2H4_9NOCA|nr:hypothetical protein [Nocardia veterana]NKY88976.1 hypothetical protein [Nocardia veterana]
MKFGTFAATSILAAITVGISAGTVNASPSAASPAPAKEITASGIDRGVGYHAVLSDFSRVLTTVVDHGRFEVNSDATAVDLKSDNGTALVTVPLSYRMSNTTVHVAQHISEDGHKLVLEPKPTAAEIGEMQPINSMARLTNEINQNIVGLVVGGVLGGLIGAVLGMGFLSIVTGPIGMVIGAIAGGYAMGGQPFMDAVNAVVSGQP